MYKNKYLKYKNKYLKYKNKYFKLKYGGSYQDKKYSSDDEDVIELIKILEKNINMTHKELAEEIKTQYISKYYNQKEARQLADCIAAKFWKRPSSRPTSATSSRPNSETSLTLALQSARKLRPESARTFRPEYMFLIKKKLDEAEDNIKTFISLDVKKTDVINKIKEEFKKLHESIK